MVALCDGRGIAIVAEAWGRANEVGNILQPVVLVDLQGKGQVRQRSISADKHFWLLWMPQK